MATQSMMRSRKLTLVLGMVVALVALAPRPALGCSCAWPPDIAQWLDDAPGAFVGSLIEVRRTGGNVFGGDSIFVFSVERWVKGGPGQTVEVHAPIGDGGNCGLGTETGVRLGLILHWSEGNLTSSSCSTFAPEMLVEAGHLDSDSQTMIPWLLVSGSSVFKVLDDAGRLVTRLDSRRSSEEFGQAHRTHTSVCPGGVRFVHHTESTLAIWDVQTLEIVGQVEVPDLDWPSAVSCRDREGSDVLLAVQGMGRSTVVDAYTGETRFTVDGSIGGIGATHLTSETEAGVISRLDLATGTVVELFRKPAEVDGYPTARPNPVDDTSAVMFTSWRQGSPSSLTVFDESGVATVAMDFGPDTSLGDWLDEATIVVIESTEGGQDLHFVDSRSGEITTFPGMGTSGLVADGDQVVGIVSGELIRFDPPSGTVELVASIPDQLATPVMLLAGSDRVDAPRSVHTVPPVEIPAGSGTATYFKARVLLFAILSVAIIGATIAVRRQRNGNRERGQPVESE